MSEKKVYIGTLYVGENEIDECKTSVQNQTYKKITHEVFSYLPNKEAHDTLYSRFMQLQNEYDYFIKLDADMVFKRDTIVKELVEIFEKNKNLDHVAFSVYDWYSNSDIIGMHMFSNRVRWSISKEALFVDTHPICKGEKISCRESPAPVAEHSPNPSVEEAFMFGYHRALKVVQRGKWIKNISQSKFQLDLLHKAWNCLVKERDIRRLAVIKGAEKAFLNNNKILNSKYNEEFDREIQNISNENIEESIQRLKKYWTSNNKRYFNYVIVYYIYMLPVKIMRKIIKIAKKCKKQ